MIFRVIVTATAVFFAVIMLSGCDIFAGETRVIEVPARQEAQQAPQREQRPAQAAEPTEPEEPPVILPKAAFIAASLDDGSQLFLAQEFLRFSSDFDIQVSVYDGELCPETQFYAITNAIAERYDIIILYPVHAESATPAIRRAFEEGIHIGVLFEDLSGNSQRLRRFYIGFDDFMGAEQAGLYVAENFPEGAGFAEVGGFEGSIEQLDRRDGFRAGIYGADPPIVQVASRNTPIGWSEHEALAIVRDFLTRYRARIDIIFCHWDVASAAVMETFQTYGIDDIYVVAFGGFGDFESALLGENAIAVTRDYTQMAYLALEYSNLLLHGGFVPPISIVPMEIIRFESALPEEPLPED